MEKMKKIVIGLDEVEEERNVACPSSTEGSGALAQHQLGQRNVIALCAIVAILHIIR